MLHFWDASWALDEAQCPCDVHFTQWLTEKAISGASIYHFGSGSHHHVGLDNLKRGEPNTIVCVTASPGEYDAFIKMAIAEPRLSHAYSVHFGDIYLFNGRLLPRFDVVTLFHLCEFRDERNDAYGALTDEAVLRRAIDQTNSGGFVLFYEGSFAFAFARPIIDKIAAEGLLEPVGQFKTLPIYRKP